MKRKNSGKTRVSRARVVKLEPGTQTSHTQAASSVYVVVVAQTLCHKYDVPYMDFEQRYRDALPQNPTHSRITLALVLSRLCRVIVELCRKNGQTSDAVRVRRELMPLIVSHDDRVALCPNMVSYNAAYQHVLALAVAEYMTGGAVTTEKELVRPYSRSVNNSLSRFKSTKTRTQSHQKEMCARTLQQYTAMYNVDVFTGEKRLVRESAAEPSDELLYNVMSPSQYLFQLIVVVDALCKKLKKEQPNTLHNVVDGIASDNKHDHMIPYVAGSTRKGRAPMRASTKIMRMHVQSTMGDDEGKLNIMRCGALKHLVSIGAKNQNLYHQQWSDGVCLQNPYFYEKFMENARMTQTQPAEVPVYHCDHNEQQEIPNRPNIPLCAAGSDCYYLKFTVESPKAPPLNIMLTPDEQTYYNEHKCLPKETNDTSDGRFCIDCICANQYTISKQYDEMTRHGEAVNTSPFFALSRFCVEVGGLRGHRYTQNHTYVSRAWGGVSLLYPLSVRNKFKDKPPVMNEEEHQAQLQQNFTRGVYVPRVTMSHFLVNGASAGQAKKH